MYYYIYKSFFIILNTIEKRNYICGAHLLYPNAIITCLIRFFMKSHQKVATAKSDNVHWSQFFPTDSKVGAI